MAKTKMGQNLYNKMLITQALNYQKLGYTNIKINHQNYAQGQPFDIGGYTPDISAVLDDKTILCEVVTDDSLNETQMIDRWRTFGNSGYEFHIIVSKTIFEEVKELVKDNGIFVNKYWYSKCC